MWITILKPEVNGIQPRNFRKTQKNNNLLKTKRMVNAEIKAKWGPGFYISLARFAILPPAVQPLLTN